MANIKENKYAFAVGIIIKKDTSNDEKFKYDYQLIVEKFEYGYQLAVDMKTINIKSTLDLPIYSLVHLTTKLALNFSDLKSHEIAQVLQLVSIYAKKKGNTEAAKILAHHIKSLDLQRVYEITPLLGKTFNQSFILEIAKYSSQSSKTSEYQNLEKEKQAKVINTIQGKDSIRSRASALLKLNKSIYPDQHLSIHWQDLYSLSELDEELTELWCGDRSSNDYWKAQMISARGAEKLVSRFYKGQGYSVEDLAIHQITNQSTAWMIADIRLDNTILIDVKNARRSVNSSTYSEFYVKKFKNNNGSDVTIVGVLSPYLTLQSINDGQTSFYVKNPIILGETQKSLIKHLKDIFEDSYFYLTFNRYQDCEEYLPPWLFDYNDKFYKNQLEAICEIRKNFRFDTFSYRELTKALYLNYFAVCIASKNPIPKSWEDAKPIWLESFVEILYSSPNPRISLPYLYLSILKHFLLMARSNTTNFSPRDYSKIIYPSKDSTHPLWIYDPLNTVKDLCETLTTLWEHKDSIRLSSFTSFHFSGNGLLQARKSSNDPWTTLLAYCGGKVDRKGKCGFSPLILGEHHTCPVCQKLICPCSNCHYCSESCLQEQKRFAELAELAKVRAQAQARAQANKNLVQPRITEPARDSSFFGKLKRFFNLS